MTTVTVSGFKIRKGERLYGTYVRYALYKATTEALSRRDNLFSSIGYGRRSSFAPVTFNSFKMSSNNRIFFLRTGGLFLGLIIFVSASTRTDSNS